LPPGDAVVVFVAMDCGPVDIFFLSILKKLNNTFFFLPALELPPALDVFKLDVFFDSLVLNVFNVAALGEGDVTMLGEVRPVGNSIFDGEVFTDSGVWGVGLVEDSPTVT
jgi:hypothetical protein